MNTIFIFIFNFLGDIYMWIFVLHTHCPVSRILKPFIVRCPHVFNCLHCIARCIWKFSILQTRAVSRSTPVQLVGKQPFCDKSAISQETYILLTKQIYYLMWKNSGATFTKKLEITIVQDWNHNTPGLYTLSQLHIKSVSQNQTKTEYGGRLL